MGTEKNIYEEKIVDKSKSESTRRLIEKRKQKGKVSVWVQDLEIIAGMTCEHVIRGEKPCDEADLERGGCCNACWASRWAKQQIERSRQCASET